MTSRQLRLVRGSAASSVATIIAAVSHTIGGGAAPHPLLIVALSVFLAPIAALLVGPRANILRLGAAVLLSQTVFHVLFTALGATASQTTTGVGTGHQHVMTLGPVDEGLAADAGMIGAHIVAGILTIILLARGESVLRAIARWVRAALRVRLPHLPGDWPSPASAPESVRVFVPALRIGDASRRGPPLLSCG